MTNNAKDQLVSVLVVDDEPQVRSLLRCYLEDEGFVVDEAATKTEVDQALRRSHYDVILLDVNLQSDCGLEIARILQARGGCAPIIFISGKTDVVDRVVGLEVGADDYIVKPFHLREVLARIRSVLRRQTCSCGERKLPTPIDGPSDCLSFGGWRFYPSARKLIAPDGVEKPLTTGEHGLLEVLAKRPKRPLSRSQLMDLLKGETWAPYDRAVDSQVRRLRKKIESDPAEPQFIKTVRGVGYVFAADVHTE